MAAIPPPQVPGLFMGPLRFSGQYDKTADYTIPANAFIGALFTNAGAVGAVVITLPALAPNRVFGFRVIADQTLTVASAAGDDMVTKNDASADSVAFSTANEKIGGGVLIESNSDGTKWLVTNISAGSNTITVAT